MELNLANQTQSPVQAIIQQIAFSDNLMQNLKATNMIINSLDNELKTKTNAIKIKKILIESRKDKRFMRKLTYLSKIKSNTELAVEYLGFDYPSSPDYQYDIKVEQRMVEIEEQLEEFLGKLLRELNKGAEIKL